MPNQLFLVPGVNWSLRIMEFHLPFQPPSRSFPKHISDTSQRGTNAHCLHCDTVIPNEVSDAVAVLSRRWVRNIVMLYYSNHILFD